MVPFRPQDPRSLLLLVLAVSIFDPANALPEPKPSLTFPRHPTNRQNKKHNQHAHIIVDVTTTLRGGGKTNTPKQGLIARPQLQRGGAEIDKSTTWTLSKISSMDIVYLALHGTLLTAICLFCRNAERTGGRAPTWITNWVGDPYATVVLHVGYFGVGALLPTLLPSGLSRIIFSPPSVALLGTVFPAVESVRAAVTDSGSDDRVSKTLERQVKSWRDVSRLEWDHRWLIFYFCSLSFAQFIICCLET